MGLFPQALRVQIDRHRCFNGGAFVYLEISNRPNDSWANPFHSAARSLDLYLLCLRVVIHKSNWRCNVLVPRKSDMAVFNDPLALCRVHDVDQFPKKQMKLRSLY